MTIEQENAILREIVTSTLWMARRYADGRSTAAPDTVNHAIDAALTVGIKIGPDTTLGGRMYAVDGMFGTIHPEPVTT